MHAASAHKGPLGSSARPSAALHAPAAAGPVAPSLTAPAAPGSTDARRAPGVVGCSCAAAPGPAGLLQPWGASMDRHSSYIFIWLQLELCAMAVLLTKGGCPPASWGAGSPGRGARGPEAAAVSGFEAGCQGFVSGGRGFLPRRSPQVATSCLFLEVAAVASRLPPRVSRGRRVQMESDFRASGCQNVCVSLSVVNV